MKLQDALSKIHAPKGATTIIAGLASGNFDPIRDQNAVGESLQSAREKLKSAEDAQNSAQSDWAYWGFAGDVAYWRCVVNLLEAAEITGADNLPDVPPPDLEGVVMDVQANLQQWGADVLKKALSANDWSTVPLDLKPCPFCGGKATNGCLDAGAPYPGGYFYIGCESEGCPCHPQSDVGCVEKGYDANKTEIMLRLAARWNTRVQP